MVKPLGASIGVLTASVLASLLYTIATTENPAQIPFRLVFRRAAFGMCLFVAFWLPTCILFAWLLHHWIPLLDSEPLRWCSLILIGLVVPQAGKLKDALLTPRLAKSLTILQFFDEETRLYLSRIINREERKASTLFLREDAERLALDRLFEEHNIEIVREEAKKLKPPETALNIFKVRHLAVKFKYLIRHLGYSDCRDALHAVATNPQMILPTWPAGLGDRRSGRGEGDDTSGAGPARRKYERSYVRAYVLGTVDAGSETGRALSLWKEKLTFLQEQEALAVDAEQRFVLKKHIEEAARRIRELGG